jgi:hypothetical protein
VSQPPPADDHQGDSAQHQQQGQRRGPASLAVAVAGEFGRLAQRRGPAFGPPDDGDHCQVQDDQADALGAADPAEQGKGGSAAGDCGAGGVAAQPRSREPKLIGVITQAAPITKVSMVTFAPTASPAPMAGWCREAAMSPAGARRRVPAGPR